MPMMIRGQSSGLVGSTASTVKVTSALVTASFSTASTTFVDVTGYTLTLSGLDASASYDLFACFDLSEIASSDANNGGQIQLLIDGTVSSCKILEQCGANERYPCTLSSTKLVTGATSYICKLQCKKATAGNFLVNASTLTSSMFIMAVKR